MIRVIQKMPQSGVEGIETEKAGSECSVVLNQLRTDFD